MEALRFLTAVAFILIYRASAKTITVGDTLGWTDFDVAIQRVPDYAAWALSEDFAPGDSVVFNYTPTKQNVYLMPSKADFDSCNFGKATLLDDGTSGSYTWKAPTQEGTYYFACNKPMQGQGTHCESGQKVSIIVSSKGLATPAPVSLPPEATGSEPPLPAEPVTSPASPLSSVAPSSATKLPSPLGEHGQPLTTAPSTNISYSRRRICNPLQFWSCLILLCFLALLQH